MGQISGGGGAALIPDNFHEVGNGTVKILEGGSAVVADPTTVFNGAMIDNCSACDILVQVTHVLDTKSGAVAPKVDCLRIKAGKWKSFDFKNDTIDSISIAQLDKATVVDNAYTDSKTLAPLAATTAEIEVDITWLNC